MDELDISGKRYISTRRAGREHGYHSDYIGQLIRSGKVKGQKVGRAWYVDDESLVTYLGKEYIETSTPVAIANDELQIKSRTEEDIEIKKDLPDTAPVSEEIVIQVKKAEERNSEEPSEEPSEEKIEERAVPMHLARLEGHPLGGLTYIADTEPLLPQIPVHHKTVGQMYTSESSSSTSAPAPKKKPPKVLPIFAAVIGLLIVGATTLLAASLSSTTSIVEGKAAAAYLSFGQ